MEHHEELQLHKTTRQRTQEAERTRPIVHGVLPYLGHRPKSKHERRRLAHVVRRARKQA